MRTKRSREGFLLIDHSNSPGISAEFVRASGVDAPIVPGGTAFKTPMFRCCHCGTHVILNPDRSRPRGHCRRCDRYVCDNPACNSECRPYKKMIDQEQERLFRKENHYG